MLALQRDVTSRLDNKRKGGTNFYCPSQCQEINQASCDIAKRISGRWGTIIAGGIVQTGAYKKGEGREEVQKELKEGLEILIENDIELIIVEVGVGQVVCASLTVRLFSISTVLRRWSGHWSWLSATASL